MIHFLLVFFGTKAQLQLEIVFLNENHLRKLFKEYFDYYIVQRTLLGLNKDSPESRPVQVNWKN